MDRRTARDGTSVLSPSWADRQALPVVSRRVAQPTRPHERSVGRASRSAFMSCVHRPLLIGSSLDGGAWSLGVGERVSSSEHCPAARPTPTSANTTGWGSAESGSRPTRGDDRGVAHGLLPGQQWLASPRGARLPGRDSVAQAPGCALPGGHLPPVGASLGRRGRCYVGSRPWLRSHASGSIASPPPGCTSRWR